MNQVLGVLRDTSEQEKPNSRCCSPVPLSLVIPELLRLSCLGTSLSNRRSHTLHMLSYDSHGSNNSYSNGSWDGEQAWWGFKSKGYAYLGFNLMQSRLNDARIR